MKTGKLLLNILIIALLSFSMACKSQFNKGVTNRKELRARKPPSVKFMEGYEKTAKKASRGQKDLKGKSGKSLERALLKQRDKKLRKDKRYLKKRKKQAKKNY